MARVGGITLHYITLTELVPARQWKHQEPVAGRWLWAQKEGAAWVLGHGCPRPVVGTQGLAGGHPGLWWHGHPGALVAGTFCV